jgi:hypothetical protein
MIGGATTWQTAGDRARQLIQQLVAPALSLRQSPLPPRMAPSRACLLIYKSITISSQQDPVVLVFRTFMLSVSVTVYCILSESPFYSFSDSETSPYTLKF